MLAGRSPKQIIDDRYEKFRRMGAFFTEYSRHEEAGPVGHHLS